MKKMRIASLLLALMLLFGGCAAKDDAVIVSVNGETVDKATINQQIINKINYNEQMNALYMAYYGINAALPTDRETVTETVLNSNVNQLVAIQKAKALGLDQFTPEETEQIMTDALDTFDMQLDSIIANLYPDLEAEEARQKAEAYAAENNVTIETLIEAQTHNELINRLTDYVIQDVSVSEEAVTEMLNQKMEENKAAFAETPSLFGDYVNFGMDIAYYAPAGYRQVKHILVEFDEADTAIITEKQELLAAAASALATASEEEKAALQPQMDAAQAALDEALETARENRRPYVDEVYAKATAPEADFDALVEEYSADFAAPTDGYVLYDGYPSFTEAFYNSAMALEQVGDISPIVETDYGFHILQYAGDLAEGPYDTESCREMLAEDMLYQAQETHFDEQMTLWINEANIKTYPNRLK